MSERAVIYMRKSVEDEGTHSFDFQAADCREYATRQGYSVAESLVEPGMSGHDSLDTRPVLKELRRMVRNRDVDVVLVWRYDRLARDFLDQAVLIREARDAGVRVESATEPVPDGPMGWVMQAVIGGMSEEAWHATRQRLGAGVKKHVEKGLYLPGKTPPYGYMWVDSRKERLVENPLTAPVVIRIFELVSGGMSARAVARLLSQERIPSPWGRSYWHQSAIFKIIYNPIYYGVALAFRNKKSWERVADPISGEMTKRRRSRLSDTPVVLPEGTAPALVSPTVAQLARERLTQHQTHPLSGRVADMSSYLLRGGLAECGVCNGALTVRTRGRTPTTQPIYRCTRSRNPSAHPAHSLGITTRQLDDFVWSTFVESVSDAPVVEETLRRLVDRRDEEVLSELSVRKSLLDENREQQAGLVETLTMLKQDTAKARIVHQLDLLSVEEEKLRGDISELERRDAVFSAAEAVLRKFSVLRSSTDLDSLSIAERRRLLWDFGVRVRVSPVGRNSHVGTAERCEVQIDVLTRANRIPKPSPPAT